MLLVINANFVYIQVITIVKAILLQFKVCKLKNIYMFFSVISCCYAQLVIIVPLKSEIAAILFFFMNLVIPLIIFSQVLGLMKFPVPT